MRDRAHPLRTCVGCRRVLPQAALVRLTRTPDGFVEPDRGRRREGRGAYLCHRERCLTETLRRGRWAQAFRASARMKPETISALEALRGVTAGTGWADERPEPEDTAGRIGRRTRRGAARHENEA